MLYFLYINTGNTPLGICQWNSQCMFLAPQRSAWCWQLSAEPAPLTRGCNVDLNGLVMWLTGSICGALGVYLVDYNHAVISWHLLWAAHLVVTHFSCSVLDVEQPVRRDMVARFRRTLPSESMWNQDHLQLDHIMASFYLFNFLKVKFGQYTNLGCASTKPSKTYFVWVILVFHFFKKGLRFRLPQRQTYECCILGFLMVIARRLSSSSPKHFKQAITPPPSCNLSPSALSSSPLISPQIKLPDQLCDDKKTFLTAGAFLNHESSSQSSSAVSSTVHIAVQSQCFYSPVFRHSVGSDGCICTSKDKQRWNHSPVYCLFGVSSWLVVVQGSFEALAGRCDFRRRDELRGKL